MSLTCKWGELKFNYVCKQVSPCHWIDRDGCRVITAVDWLEMTTRLVGLLIDAQRRIRHLQTEAEGPISIIYEQKVNAVVFLRCACILTRKHASPLCGKRSSVSKGNRLTQFSNSIIVILWVRQREASVAMTEDGCKVAFNSGSYSLRMSHKSTE